jgi:hypothetical protein
MPALALKCVPAWMHVHVNVQTGSPTELGSGKQRLPSDPTTCDSASDRIDRQGLLTRLVRLER